MDDLLFTKDNRLKMIKTDPIRKPTVKHSPIKENPVKAIIKASPKARRQQIVPKKTPINSQKSTAVALFESEESYRNLFKDFPVAIWEEDLSALKTRFDELRKKGIKDFRNYFDNHHEEVNELSALVKVLQKNVMSDKVLGKMDKVHASRGLPRHYTKESRRVFKEQLISLAEGSRNFRSEIQTVNNNGEPITLDLNLSVQSGYEDNLSRVLVSFVDITNQEYAENIINTIREPLIALDQDLRVVSVSRSFYEVFKVDPSETIGQLIYDLGNKQWDIPKLRKLLETILPQRTTFNAYEVEHDFATIGKRVMLLNARQIERVLGKEKVILLAIEDITERRDIEKGLEKTRQQLAEIKNSEDAAREFAESVIDTVPRPLIALDQDLRVVAVSRSFYDVFKVNPMETMGQRIYDLGNKQWDIPKLRELLETILPKHATFDNYEVEHEFATIGKRNMVLNARQIKREAGKEKLILLAIDDITVRREIENGLKKAHLELEELAAELKRAAQVKSEFLANMSHELRTPLNSINGFSEILYDGTFGPLNEKQKQYVNNVLVSGKHLLLLINQILDSAKLEAGKMRLSLSILPMKSLLHDMSLLVADMAIKKKLHMTFDIAEDLPDIEGDELKVKEILYNLISNAVKFTPEEGKIGLRAKKTDSTITIEVWDTGVGIAPENLEKVFEGFFRVDTPYSRITEGTGLGLPLSRKLVDLHGGSLSVESEGLNKGSVIRFTLPVISRKVV